MNDQSRSAPSEEQSRQVAEAARETEWAAPSFVRELFLGRFRLDLIHPYPEQTPEDRRKTDEYIAKLEKFLRANVDADEIDRTGELPEKVVEGLKELGAFGMKIPEEYGGIGLSQVGYGRAIQMVTSIDGSLVALLSAHQSIGVPQPIKMFGTPEQKKKYLPRLAKGAVSAFALTEAAVGSDPAAMTTTATPTEDGEAFILNGEKLWCTNGTIAELLVVMARTPAKVKGGKEIPQITAFVVEVDTPGVEVTHRCRFMGIKAIQNAVISFDNVRVPRENIILGEGKGLKLALVTLNTGRLTLPMSAAAGGKVCTEISRKWAAERVQWGAPIGKHDAVAQMLGGMASDTFAMESVAELSSALADHAKNDIRLEAAIAKLWTTEIGWRIVDDCLQIRGGRGYETADSLKARGELPIPVERIMRDFRINRIFEGSSEIMRLFIAREAVDTHLEVAGDLLKTDLSPAEKAKAFSKVGAHYAGWLPQRFVGWGRWPRYSEFGDLADHMRFIDRTSRKLARTLFYAMARYQAKLERKQAILGRFVDIGAELYAMAATCVRAHSMRKSAEGEKAIQMASVFCDRSRHRIDQLFERLFDNADDSTYRLAQRVLKGEHAWLESGVTQVIPDGADVAPDPHGADRDTEGERKLSGASKATQLGTA
ncbi:MAG TPA: acyl-CoA dehydrogenase family protein [Longimicrobiaceae bacterium]|nr:acyl-CoA dehydrogenase family protein [Longimicrobiaceae bacterium]